MSELANSAINRFRPLGGAEFNSNTDPDFAMEVSADYARFSLRMDLEHMDKAAAAFGSDIPVRPGGICVNGEKTALWLGPDEWLLLAPEASSEEIALNFSTLGETVPHSLVDVSDRTLAIELSGPQATRALNAGCPLDLENMPVPHCTRTVLDKAQIILVKQEKQKYRLEIVRSFAPYVWTFLKKVGNELPAD
jgi:sarcosine oxidase, subunit gamma